MKKIRVCLARLVGSLSVFLGAMAVAMSHTAFALPELDRVINGELELNQTSNALTLIQGSDQLSVDFHHFDIGVDEHVIVEQPSADALMIGHIHSGQTTDIAGQLSANGQVFLINPEGFVFHQDAQVDTQALLLSTLAVQAQSPNRWQLNATSEGRIENHGTIRVAEQGAVVMLGAQIANHGIIEAPKGQVVLANAQQALLELSSSGVKLALSQAALQSVIENTGVIIADGGKVVLSQAQTEHVLSQHILQQGIIRANRIDQDQGEVRLVSSGDVLLSGNIQARSGKIAIAASRFGLLGELDVSSQGADAGAIHVLASDKLVLAPTARIWADASERFNSAEVILKAFDTAIFAQGATISATAEHAQGGFVEISAQHNLAIQGVVDTRSAYGESGLFYIDPINIEITNQSNDIDFSGGVFSATALGARLNVDDINQQLQNGNVTITTQGPGDQQGDIELNADLDLDGGQDHRLTIYADGNLTLNQAIIDSNRNNDDNVQLSLTAGGNLTISADSGIDVDGGKMRIVVGGNMTLTGLRTRNSADDAIAITVGNGLFDGGDLGPDISSPGGKATFQALGFIDQFERVDLNTPNVSLPPISNPIDELIESIIDTQAPLPEANNTDSVAIERVFANLFSCEIDRFAAQCALEQHLQGFLEQMLIGGRLPE